MKLFRPHCIVSVQDSEKILALHNNDKRFVFRPEPTGCYWQSKDGRAFQHVIDPNGKNHIDPEDIPENELLLAVEDESEAEGIMSTIQGGMLLALPDDGLANFKFEIYEVSPDFNEAIYKEKWYYSKFRKFDNLLFGNQVWQVAKEDRVLLYSVEKYKLSLELSSFNPFLASPRYGQLFSHYEHNYSYHTKAAFAIISAFSAIEEMKLEVRSSEKNPRWANKETGEWNPVVLDSVQKRLDEINIGTDDRIDWIFRGEPTKVELDFKPYFGTESEWVNGKDVRDKSLTYPEAIHNASYLRNFIAAHKFNELTGYLNPYDVFNIQNLVRRLLMMKMKLWNPLNKG